MNFRLLRADEIECRVNQINEKGLTLLLYKDARSDMNMLDEVVGAENWQCKYEEHKGTLFCYIGIRVENEWIWKGDAGAPSNMESQKGEASDAFKRAAVRWGLGRALYSSPFIWVDSSQYKSTKKGDRFQTYDKFRVTHIAYQDGDITELRIVNDSNGGREVYSYGLQKAQKQASAKGTQNSTAKTEKAPEIAPRGQNDYITELERDDLADRCAKDHIDVNALCLLYGIFSLEETTVKQHKNMLANWDKIKEKFG